MSASVNNDDRTSDDVRREIRKLAVYLSDNYRFRDFAHIGKDLVSVDWSVPNRDSASVLVYDDGRVDIGSSMKERHPNGGSYDIRFDPVSESEVATILGQVRDFLLERALLKAKFDLDVEREEREKERQRTEAWDYLLGKGVIEK